MLHFQALRERENRHIVLIVFSVLIPLIFGKPTLVLKSHCLTVSLSHSRELPHWCSVTTPYKSNMVEDKRQVQCIGYRNSIYINSPRSSPSLNSIPSFLSFSKVSYSHNLPKLLCSSSHSQNPFRILHTYSYLMYSNWIRPPRKKVAIVGTGVAGIGALWALNGTPCDVYLYDSEDRLGGHANTVIFHHKKFSTKVDTGFIVLNDATYRVYLQFLNRSPR
jgi:hypothetical protein